MPGVSRNGATLAAGRARGFADRRRRGSRGRWRCRCCSGRAALKAARLARRRHDARESVRPLAVAAGAALVSTLLAAGRIGIERRGRCGRGRHGGRCWRAPSSWSATGAAEPPRRGHVDSVRRTPDELGAPGAGKVCRLCQPQADKIDTPRRRPAAGAPPPRLPPPRTALGEPRGGRRITAAQRRRTALRMPSRLLRLTVRHNRGDEQRLRPRGRRHGRRRPGGRGPRGRAAEHRHGPRPAHGAAARPLRRRRRGRAEPGHRHRHGRRRLEAHRRRAHRPVRHGRHRLRGHERQRRRVRGGGADRPARLPRGGGSRPGRLRRDRDAASRRGAELAGVEIPGGEVAVLPELIRGHPSPGGLDLTAACFGTVALDAIVTGAACAPGDALLGLPSSGLHSNGYTLARARAGAAGPGRAAAGPRRRLGGRRAARADGDLRARGAGPAALRAARPRPRPHHRRRAGEPPAAQRRRGLRGRGAAARCPPCSS